MCMVGGDSTAERKEDKLIKMFCEQALKNVRQKVPWIAYLCWNLCLQYSVQSLKLEKGAEKLHGTEQKKLSKHLTANSAVFF